MNHRIPGSETWRNRHLRNTVSGVPHQAAARHTARRLARGVQAKARRRYEPSLHAHDGNSKVRVAICTQLGVGSAHRDEGNAASGFAHRSDAGNIVCPRGAGVQRTARGRCEPHRLYEYGQVVAKVMIHAARGCGG